MYKTLEETDFDFVDTEEALDDMVSHLSEATEIAVDLEAHVMRSY